MSMKNNPLISQRQYRLGETYLLENAIKCRGVVEIGDYRVKYTSNYLEHTVTMHVCNVHVATWYIDIDKVVCYVVSSEPDFRDLMLDYEIFKDIVLEYQYFNMLEERC